MGEASGAYWTWTRFIASVKSFQTSGGNSSAVVGHPPHRHSLGAIADGAQIGRRDASYPLGQKFYREPLDKPDAVQVLA